MLKIKNNYILSLKIVAIIIEDERWGKIGLVP